MKRFTDTELWDKEWFMDLSPKLKCLVKYVFDKCDSAGIYSPNWKLASMYIGEHVSESDLLNISSDLFEKMPDGRIFIPGFTLFQCGELTEKCAPHKPIIQILKKNGLFERVTKGYFKGIHTLEEKEEDKEEEMDKEEEEEKEKEKKKETSENSKKVIRHLNEIYGSRYREDTMPPAKMIDARIKEGYKLDELFEIIEYKVAEWKGTPEQKWLTPETLFRPDNCSKYRSQVQNAKITGMTIDQIRNKPNTNKKIHKDELRQGVASLYR